LNDARTQPPNPENPTPAALVAFGANLPSGDLSPSRSVALAMARLAERADGACAVSRLYRTPAFPPGSGPAFVNAAMRIGWRRGADALLAALHRIEARFGRTRTARWEARIMDLDLIALGRQVAPDPETQRGWANLPAEDAARTVPDRLILPHPRLAERAFVLVPLSDVAGDWVHPVTGLSVARMLARLPEGDRAAITPLDGEDGEPFPRSPLVKPGFRD